MLDNQQSLNENFPPLNQTTTIPSTNQNKLTNTVWDGLSNKAKKLRPIEIEGSEPSTSQSCSPPHSSNSGSSEAKSAEMVNITKKEEEKLIPTQSHAQTITTSFQELDKMFELGLKVGFLRTNFTLKLEKILDDFRVGYFGDFIATPLEPTLHDETTPSEPMADLILDWKEWTSRIVLTIDHPGEESKRASNHFKKSFEHAISLWPAGIIINCPDNEFILLSIGTTLSTYFEQRVDSPSIMLNFMELQANHPTVIDQHRTDCPFENCDDNIEDYSSWKTWNEIRTDLVCNNKLGVCLNIDYNFNELNDEQLDRWMGEPVRLIIIDTDQFVRSQQDYHQLDLPTKTKNFIRRLVKATSYTTGFLVAGNKENEDIKEFVIYLDQFANELQKEKERNLASLQLTDLKQLPLQPLSSNLGSRVYCGFEQDKPKYIHYQKSMIEALEHIIATDDRNKRRYNIMVLGAGRGPLVDEFIKTIVESKTKKKFKIFVLDKNPSAIASLKHKQYWFWTGHSSLYETEIVESDMREWDPDVKADLIITELLGSFGDNELSPECIDGAWRCATYKTISIPQQYTSYLSPVSYYNMFEVVNRESRRYNRKPLDELYVVNMANYYSIAKPQALFEFVHKDLSLPPSNRDNERYKRLEFESRIDTVCHGFAGYFSSQLFGSVHISIVPGSETPDMQSWFPAFIPLETPLQMPKGTKLVVHFWRKESPTTVWYEWKLTEPIRSKVYSLAGNGTAMSKFL